MSIQTEGDRIRALEFQMRDMHEANGKLWRRVQSLEHRVKKAREERRMIRRMLLDLGTAARSTLAAGWIRDWFDARDKRRQRMIDRAKKAWTPPTNT